MQPTGHLRGDAVRVGGDARQRFYDARGYGRPLDGNEIALSRVEAAHLLFRGDLSGIELESGSDPVGFERFFVASAAAADRFAVRFLVYSDLRDRGFYLSPAREPWPGGSDAPSDAVDFVAYERGETPDTGNVKYPIQVVGERESVAAAELSGRTLAVVDEESDITYFAAEGGRIDGATDYEPPADLTGVLLADRVVVWDAPADLYERGFYGRPLTGRAADVEGALQLSLVEAASLAADGRLSLSASVGVGDVDGKTGDAAARVVARGRDVEGERFDRRLAVYKHLRAADAVPKTGFKFGADFRTYLDVETVEDLPHSEHLVRVVGPDHEFSPRELSLDVRLAGGVRKEMVFALTAVGEGHPGNDAPSDAGVPVDGADAPVDADVEWLSVDRLTP
ncbi:tRNA splicing endonuclease [Halorubrum californiense DSM 19288]|uniref:tRNA-splicing endonuclease n=1 Tax=Halorubrum californiense DSM 19288 TaxID=1227465 RepID=M0EFV2_9EURY|nr:MULTISPECIES: tRNA-intron lyase [Halorubrum]ELZ45943.1 tRNA splicing endonuclease [Halorubrum californiense DSM 19288]TKX72304.1 tRNA-intron lyase [Halorubrum sp. GN11GM_10-3_MGM]